MVSSSILKTVWGRVRQQAAPCVAASEAALFGFTRVGLIIQPLDRERKCHPAKQSVALVSNSCHETLVAAAERRVAGDVRQQAGCGMAGVLRAG